MYIYSFDRICYCCKAKVKTYTYIHYQDFYDDVEFPYQNWMMDEVYAKKHPSNPVFDRTSLALNYPVYVLGENSGLDDIVLASKKLSDLRLFTSKQANQTYLANYCSNCGKPYGRYHLLEHITDNHLKLNVGLNIEFEI